MIYNGVDYDPWVARLLGAAKAADRKTIVVAELIGKKTGDNPHIWYDPATMLALAKSLSEALAVGRRSRPCGGLQPATWRSSSSP